MVIVLGTISLLLFLLPFRSPTARLPFLPSQRSSYADVTKLFPLSRSGKWGYIDELGSWRIAPQFDDARKFSGAYAAIKKGSLWGFIDLQGKERIRPQFDDVGNFKYGLAPVRLKRKWGYVDSRGTIVIPVRFQDASDFSEGLARVELWTRLICSGLITHSSEDFPEELSDKKIRDKFECFPAGPHVGYITRDGRFAVEPSFWEGRDYSEGLAATRYKDDWGYIDKTGRIVIPFKFGIAGPFSGGTAAVRFGDEYLSRAGYIDRSGRLAFNRTFISADKFADGLAPVRTEDGWQYIDRKGLIAIPGPFNGATTFSGGMALVDLARGDAFVDTSGFKVFRTPAGGTVEPFQNGLTLVRFPGGRLEYYNRSGALVAADVPLP